MFKLLQRVTLLACVVLATATPLRAEEGDEHLLVGNPSEATDDETNPNNFLVGGNQKEVFIVGQTDEGWAGLKTKVVET